MSIHTALSRGTSSPPPQPAWEHSCHQSSLTHFTHKHKKHGRISRHTALSRGSSSPPLATGFGPLQAWIASQWRVTRDTEAARPTKITPGQTRISDQSWVTKNTEAKHPWADHNIRSVISGMGWCMPTRIHPRQATMAGDQGHRGK